ncbi:hypothetical protein ONZ45_g3994 [Pleurotus djamor]|nr:hypothetical protein ONZ45_g3994 [Pleurotus djamor]
MDESLNALASLLDVVSEKPYDVASHAQYIRLADSTEGMEAEAIAARELMSNFLLCGDEVWSTLIDAKQAALESTSSSDLKELIDLYARAEKDYLSIPLLQKHLEFVIEKHARFVSGEEQRPEDLEDLLSTDWTREEIDRIVTKAIGHLTQSHKLWDLQRDWEMTQLEATPAADRAPLVERIQLLHLTRLRQPHSTLEETAQSYSTFTTNYQPAGEYESLLISASKIRSQGAKAYERRETSERNLERSGFTLVSYAQYIAMERHLKYPDLFVLRGLYERAISEAARRRFDGESGSEEALRTFWMNYLDTLRGHEAADETMEFEVLSRAIKSVPGSGEVWSRYIRYLERVTDSQDAPAEHIYAKALETNMIQNDVEQIVPLVLARAGYERRRIEAGAADPDAFAVLIACLQNGIELVRAASPSGDSRYRLEKNLAEIYLRLADLPEEGAGVWLTTTKHYKTSYLAWTSYIDTLTKQDKHDQVRAIYKDLHMKNLDWPEAIWDSWLNFEHLYGTVQDIDHCLERIERAQYSANKRRAKEAEKAAYQAAQVAAEQQALAPQPVQVDADTAMEIDALIETVDTSRKRKAEDDSTESSDVHKKPKTSAPPPPLKRDREHCTVFVSDLPDTATEEDITNLFKDCGSIREVKVTKLPDSVALVATVEFSEKDSVPAALTKDKKRLHDQEIAVHLAWQSTLYITNFPAQSNDASIRELFIQYGTIFDYTSPTAAQQALQLHGRELEPGLPLNVYISNPERKKERSDQDANEKEVYVAGLSKFTTKEDLMKIFSTYGQVKDIRMATFDDGNSRGFAFVEYHDEAHAQAALAANNYELKKRRIAVTLANAKVRSREKGPESGFGKRTDERNRSLRVKNLPDGTQEGLLQQFFENIAPVARVEVFQQRKEAVVTLQNIADVGKLMLRSEPLTYECNALQLSEEASEKMAPAPTPKAAGGLFVPRRAAVSRPRAGLGHSRAPKAAPATTQASSTASSASARPANAKGQDDFRKMLG